KPTDLVVDHDGSLFVADWADGQRPRRGRGRIYHVRYVGKSGESPEEKTPRPDRLDAESSLERCRAQEALERRGQKGLAEVVAALEPKRLGVRGRLHAVWALVKVAGPEAARRLFALAQSDPDPRVQAQAVRALADLADPVLVRHRLDAGRGDAAIARRLASLAEGRDPRVLLEVVIALGRLRWAGAPARVRRAGKGPPPAPAHPAQGAPPPRGDFARRPKTSRRPRRRAVPGRRPPRRRRSVRHAGSGRTGRAIAAGGSPRPAPRVCRRVDARLQ